MQRRAVPCGVVPCVRCRAVPCFAEFSLSCTPDDNASKHTELAIASMYVHMSSGNFRRLLIITSFSVAVFIFHLFLDWHKHPRAVRMQQQTAAPQYVYSPEYELYAVEPRAQQSTAQSPLHKAADQVHADQSTYQSMYCTYMNAASRLFFWSIKLLALASRLFAPKMLNHLHYICL